MPEKRFTTLDDIDAHAEKAYRNLVSQMNGESNGSNGAIFGTLGPIGANAFLNGQVPFDHIGANAILGGNPDAATEQRDDPAEEWGGSNPDGDAPREWEEDKPIAGGDASRPITGPGRPVVERPPQPPSEDDPPGDPPHGPPIDLSECECLTVLVPDEFTIDDTVEGAASVEPVAIQLRINAISNTDKVIKVRYSVKPNRVRMVSGGQNSLMPADFQPLNPLPTRGEMDCPGLLGLQLSLRPGAASRLVSRAYDVMRSFGGAPDDPPPETVEFVQELMVTVAGTQCPVEVKYTVKPCSLEAARAAAEALSVRQGYTVFDPSSTVQFANVSSWDMQFNYGFPPCGICVRVQSVVVFDTHHFKQCCCDYIRDLGSTVYYEAWFCEELWSDPSMAGTLMQIAQQMDAFVADFVAEQQAEIRRDPAVQCRYSGHCESPVPQITLGAEDLFTCDFWHSWDIDPARGQPSSPNHGGGVHSSGKDESCNHVSESARFQQIGFELLSKGITKQILSDAREQSLKGARARHAVYSAYANLGRNNVWMECLTHVSKQVVEVSTSVARVAELASTWSTTRNVINLIPALFPFATLTRLMEETLIDMSANELSKTLLEARDWGLKFGAALFKDAEIGLPLVFGWATPGTLQPNGTGVTEQWKKAALSCAAEGATLSEKDGLIVLDNPCRANERGAKPECCIAMVGAEQIQGGRSVILQDGGPPELDKVEAISRAAQNALNSVAYLSLRAAWRVLKSGVDSMPGMKGAVDLLTLPVNTAFDLLDGLSELLTPMYKTYYGMQSDPSSVQNAFEVVKFANHFCCNWGPSSSPLPGTFLGDRGMYRAASKRSGGNLAFNRHYPRGYSAR